MNWSIKHFLYRTFILIVSGVFLIQSSPFQYSFVFADEGTGFEHEAIGESLLTLPYETIESGETGLTPTNEVGQCLMLDDDVCDAQRITVTEIADSSRSEYGYQEGEEIVVDLRECEQSCGHKAGIVFTYEQIQEATKCATYTTCDEAIKQYCSGDLDHLVADPISVLHAAGDESCPVYVLSEKPLGAAIPQEHFVCGEGCAQEMILPFNQRFMGENECTHMFDCEDAMVATCNGICSVAFDGDYIAPNSSYDPERAQTGKSAASKIAGSINSTIKTTKTVAKILSHDEGLLNDLLQAIGADFLINGSQAFLTFINENREFLDFFQALESGDHGGLASAALEISAKYSGETAAPYIMLAANIADGNRGGVVTEASIIAVKHGLANSIPAIGALAALLEGDYVKAIEGVLKFAAKELASKLLGKLVPLAGALYQLGDSLASDPPDYAKAAIAIVGGVIDFFLPGVGTLIMAGLNVVRDFFFPPDYRGKTFKCKQGCVAALDTEIELREIERRTGCQGETDCADEAYLRCQGYALASEDNLIESCHACDTDNFTMTSAGEAIREVSDGDKTDEEFLDLLYQCSGDMCVEQSGSSIKAREAFWSYGCMEYSNEGQHYFVDDFLPESERTGCAQGDNCWKQCVEDGAKQYCMGIPGQYIATDNCVAHLNTAGKDDYVCLWGCGVMPGSEIGKRFLQDEYGCDSDESCQYYAKLTCINPTLAKNTEKAQEIADNTTHCTAVYDGGGWGDEYYTCSNSCGSRSGKKANDDDLRAEHGCIGRYQCQRFAEDRCTQTEEPIGAGTCEVKGDYECKSGCEKPEKTKIKKKDLEQDYGCEGNGCKTLAIQFCENTLSEPECSVRKVDSAALNITEQDHWTCTKGCALPQGRKLMKYSVEDKLSCDGWDNCKPKAIEYCEGQHQNIGIADQGKWDDFTDVIDDVGGVLNKAEGLINQIGAFGIDLGKMGVIIDVSGDIINTIDTSLGQLNQVFSTDFSDFDSVIASVYILDNAKESLQNILSVFANSFEEIATTAPDLSCELTLIEGLDATGSETFGVISTIAQGGHMNYVNHIVGGLELLGLGPTGDGPDQWQASGGADGVIGIGEECPDLQDILGTPEEYHGAPEGATFAGIGSCTDKIALLDHICDDTMPAEFTMETIEQDVFIYPAGMQPQDLTCGTTMEWDCNPFEGDLLKVHIYDYVDLIDPSDLGVSEEDDETDTSDDNKTNEEDDETESSGTFDGVCANFASCAEIPLQGLCQAPLCKREFDNCVDALDCAVFTSASSCSEHRECTWFDEVSGDEPFNTNGDLPTFGVQSDTGSSTQNFLQRTEGVLTTHSFGKSLFQASGGFTVQGDAGESGGEEPSIFNGFDNANNFVVTDLEINEQSCDFDYVCEIYIQNNFISADYDPCVDETPVAIDCLSLENIEMQDDGLFIIIGAHILGLLQDQGLDVTTDTLTRVSMCKAQENEEHNSGIDCSQLNGCNDLCIEEGILDPDCDNDDDGVIGSSDCDDMDPTIGDRSTDFDCDGVLTDNDCDDKDKLVSVSLSLPADNVEGMCEDNVILCTDGVRDADPSSNYELSEQLCEVPHLLEDHDCDGYNAYSDSDCDAALGDIDGEVIDNDNDGFPLSVDCDDFDDNEFPGQIRYIDNDKDGYSGNEHDNSYVIGQFSQPEVFDWYMSHIQIESCERPEGNLFSRKELKGILNDCNDVYATSSNIHPGQAEICDIEDIDNDCDGDIPLHDTDCIGFEQNVGCVDDQDCDGFSSDIDCDDQDPLEYPGQIWYEDADADGYSQDLSTDVIRKMVDPYDELSTDDIQLFLEGYELKISCERPSTYSYASVQLKGTGNDCDGLDVSIHPGVIGECDSLSDPTCDEELCSNGIDDDCDGEIDECSTEGVIYLDNDQDGFYENVDCDDTNPNVHPETQEICDNGIDDDCDKLVDMNDENCLGLCSVEDEDAGLENVIQNCFGANLDNIGEPIVVNNRQSNIFVMEGNPEYDNNCKIGSEFSITKDMIDGFDGFVNFILENQVWFENYIGYLALMVASHYEGDIEISFIDGEYSISSIDEDYNHLEKMPPGYEDFIELRDILFKAVLDGEPDLLEQQPDYFKLSVDYVDGKYDVVEGDTFRSIVRGLFWSWGVRRYLYCLGENTMTWTIPDAIQVQTNDLSIGYENMDQTDFNAEVNGDDILSEINGKINTIGVESWSSGRKLCLSQCISSHLIKRTSGHHETYSSDISAQVGNVEGMCLNFANINSYISSEMLGLKEVDNSIVMTTSEIANNGEGDGAKDKIAYHALNKILIDGKVYHYEPQSNTCELYLY